MPSESPTDLSLTSKTAADREGAPTRREAAPPADASGAKPSPKARLRGLVGIFLGLALIVPMIGLGIVYLHAPQLREQTFADLSAVAELKARADRILAGRAARRRSRARRQPRLY